VKRVGILGGTFNPIHTGHLAMAQMAMEKMKLDEVVFVPSNTPPHKVIKNLASAKHRYNMVQLAIRGNSSLKISDFEVKRKGKSYTINTLLYFKDSYPKGTKFFLIIGKDMLPGLKKWRNIDEIIKLASFVVINRPRYDNLKTTIKHHSVFMPEIDVSSSFLRKQIAQEKSIKYLVPDNTYDYIKRHKLYKK